MEKVSIRISEEEKALLREQAEAAGQTVSELIRDRLFPRNLSGTPATFGQVAELAKRVAALSDEVGRLSAEQENPSASERKEGAGPVSFQEAEGDLRLEKMERELGTLVQNFGELKELFLQQKASPSGWISLFSKRD